LPPVVSSAESRHTILVNGLRDDRVSVLDRGFTLGDGVFETIAVRHGRPRLWTEHMERLESGCHRLHLPVPGRDVLAEEIERCRDGEPDGAVRLTITRGPGPRGYAMPAQPQPTRSIAWFPGLPEFARSALRLRWCATRLSENPVLAGLKHLNRLEQVLARAEWDDDRIDEGIMLAPGGEVIECTSCNLFVVTGDRLLTPDLSTCGVAGVVRRRVLELAASLGLVTTVGRVAVEDIADADELFVTNVSRGIAPVAAVEDREWTAPGPVTGRLQATFEDSLA
jgi:4-amino-4-deoxychorismate lyase